MKNFLNVLKIIGQALCFLTGVWFLLPFLRGGFSLGASFGLCVCIAGFLLLHFYRRQVRRGGFHKWSIRIAAVCYGLGLAWALYLSGLVLLTSYPAAPAGSDLIVLGSQVYSAEHMGVSLTNRINTAGDYLNANPGSICIVTGGQGNDEPCAEALTEKNALIHRGIAPERIFAEDRSRNTRQNLQYAMELAQQEGLGTEFALVTQRFHMYRAFKLAKKADFTVTALVAPTDPLLFPEYFGRELLSLTKWHFELLMLR